jgi:hypothetical protein
MCTAPTFVLCACCSQRAGAAGAHVRVGPTRLCNPAARSKCWHPARSCAPHQCLAVSLLVPAVLDAHAWAHARACTHWLPALRYALTTSLGTRPGTAAFVCERFPARHRQAQAAAPARRRGSARAACDTAACACVIFGTGPQASMPRPGTRPSSRPHTEPAGRRPAQRADADATPGSTYIGQASLNRWRHSACLPPGPMQPR